MLWITSDRRKSIACILVITFVAILFMGESLLPDKILAPLDLLMGLRPWSTTDNHIATPYNGLPSDKVLYIHPIKVLVGRAWRTGLPLWEPHLQSGYPIIGNAQAGIFYPGTLPYVFLSGADASDLVALFHLVAGGLGMFGYLRSIGCRHLAALLGSIVFMLNAVFTVWLMWDSVVGVMVWLPWTLWAFESALHRRRFWIVAPGSVAVALIYLGGHLQWSLYAILALVLYSIFRLISPGTTNRRRIFWVSITMGLAGTTLAAIQILPTLEYINLGHRGAIPFETMSKVLDWSGFIMLWVPRFFGEPFAPDWWGPVNYNESVIYVGIGSLLLAMGAIVWRRDAKTLFFSGLGLLGAFSAAGTDVYRLLYELPGFNSLMPIRMRYLVVVALSVLCALGLDWLLRQPHPHRARVTVSIGLITIVLAFVYTLARTGQLPADPDRMNLVNRHELIFIILLAAAFALLLITSRSARWGSLAAAGLCALTLLDLWRLGVSYQRPISTQFYYPRTPAIQLMMDDKELFRILTIRRAWFDWQLRPNLPALFGFYDVGGYDSTYIRRYVTYLQQIDKAGQPFPGSNFLAASQFDSPLVDLLNVKYALTPDKPKLPGWKLIYKFGLRVYARTTPLPRAWLASQAQVVSDDNEILERLSAPGFDPYKMVILEQAPRESLGIASAEPPGTVSIEHYGNTVIVLNAQMQRDGWLVLSERDYPGWQATIDEIPSSLYRANYIFRAVPLSTGSHRVVLSFMPSSFVIGAAASLGAGIALLSIAVGAKHYEGKRYDLPQEN